ncbi:MAG TPA: type VI secretion system tip protein TssI/VgrG [Acidobacteriaceae bacterium]|jgi:type VI secretion system secreted protein VgrG|nr:type VI secretion system tip protein TssI/VgrG [Acidobacteriaceae bacterium]
MANSILDLRIYTQENRAVKIAIPPDDPRKTPLGGDLFLLAGFTGYEAISRLFQFDLHLQSPDADIDLTSVLGQAAMISLNLPDGEERNFQGIISAISHAGGTKGADGSNSLGLAEYRATFVPWLWLLTRQSDCRIFQNLSVPDIISQIFAKPEYQTAARFELRLHGEQAKREYCVQYRETDFNFVNRLMEEEGIWYFFEHSEDEHLLVITNYPSYSEKGPESSLLSYDYGAATNVISQWSGGAEIRPGKYTHRDYNFMTPSLNLTRSAENPIKADYEIYDYPGEYDNFTRGTYLANLRIEEEGTPSLMISGSGSCYDFAPGMLFTLANHFRAGDNGEYQLTSVYHSASQAGTFSDSSEDNAKPLKYSNRFECIPSATSFRPPRVTPEPVMRGSQTATVVGPSGEEIYTDKYGRVKVCFHWDRSTGAPEDKSCWIRVSQPSAGSGWGSVQIPRVGQEVIVDFLEGDPDQPIITGRVYNGDQMPPYPLPDKGMVSGMKSNSTKGGGGYNEISMDDTKSKEQITVHAQYDMGTTVEHDDTQTVKNNRTISVTGTHTETITKDTAITISQGNFKMDVQKGTHTHHVKGDVHETYDSNQETHVANNILVQSNNAKITIDAKTEIFLHCGESFISLKQDGTIVISGKNIQITGAQTVKAGVGNQNMVCDVQKVAISGAGINVNAVGMHNISGAVVKIN